VTLPHEFDFARENVVDVNAAVVGISASRWISVPPEQASGDIPKAIMRERRFDVLPIQEGDLVREYFVTDSWNDFSQVSRRRIEHKDIIPYHTHIREVIRALALEKRFFYFLSSDHRVVGLISVINLNCRQVQVYLFSLLCNLETAIAQHLAERMPAEQLISLYEKVARQKRTYEGTMRRFRKTNVAARRQALPNTCISPTCWIR
jgi:hypothetical protein